MRVPVFMIAGFLLLGSTAASAEVPAATDPAPAPAAATTTTTDSTATPAPAQTTQVDMNETVCKQFKITGQLIPGKPLCHTRGQWLEINRQAQEATEKAQNQTHTGATK